MNERKRGDERRWEEGGMMEERKGRGENIGKRKRREGEEGKRREEYSII